MHRRPRPFAPVLRLALAVAMLTWLPSIFHPRLLTAAPAPRPADATAPGPDASWFEPAAPHRLELRFSEGSLRSLRQDRRAYVPATLLSDGLGVTNVAVRVKGRTGSLQPIDGRPALTLEFDRFEPGRRFHGYRKLHLNNAAEDPSRLHEVLGSAIAEAAGTPVPRVTHAVVTLNGRSLGLYVVREGFAPEFFSRHFSRADGPLYEPEPGPGCDINGPMRLSDGRLPDATHGLPALAAAAAEPDPALRWTRLAPLLDREGFISFLALETLLGHRDGYSQARNNYRLYQDPATGRHAFLLSGMDRLLERPDAPLPPRFNGVLAQALVESEDGRRLYQSRLGALHANVLRAVDWPARIAAWTRRLEPALTRAEFRELQRESAGLQERLRSRIAFLDRALTQPTPAPIPFVNDVATLSGWRPVDAPTDAAQGRMEERPAQSPEPTPPSGTRASPPTPASLGTLAIVAGPRTSASWRTKVHLAQGRYRFEAVVHTFGLAPLPFGRNHGASLAVDGRTPDGTLFLTGNHAATRLQGEFTIQDRLKEVELACVVRASGGTALFERDSLRLVRLPPVPPSP